MAARASSASQHRSMHVVSSSPSDDTTEDRTDSPPQVARRLVVELNRRSAEELAWLVEEEEANKTTIVNRAIQVYAMVTRNQLEGRSITIVDNETGEGRIIEIF